MNNFRTEDLKNRCRELPEVNIFRDLPTYSEKAVQAIEISNRTKPVCHEQDVRSEIGCEMALPIEVVSEFLVCSDFLENPALKNLNVAKLNKRQYQDILKITQRVALELRQDGLTDKEVRPWITKLVMGILDERERHGRIILKPWFLEWDVLIGYEKKVPKASAKPCRIYKKKSFSYSPGVTRALYGPKTVEEIQEKFYQTIRDLSNLPEINPNSFKPFKKGLIQAIGYLARISVAIIDLEKDHTQEVADGNTD